MFANFLNEIASHGFLVVANGARTPGIGTQTTYRDLLKSLDWLNTPAAQKYGKLDLSKIAVAGQSCGGLEAVRQLND
jgi:dipeptidyl aminopeptidase/acylaminoacyl peptidase